MAAQKPENRKKREYLAFRAFSRAVDSILYLVIWHAIALFTMRIYFIDRFPNWLIYSLGWLAVMLLMEPLLLCLFGATIGKAIVGLRVAYGKSEKNPTYLIAFWRTLLLFFPFKGAALDRRFPLRLTESLLRQLVAFVCMFAMLLSLLMGASYIRAMPIYQGPLTVSAYIANCNDILQRGSATRDLYMDGSTWIHALDSYRGPEPAQQELLMHDGNVIGVRIFFDLRPVGDKSSLKMEEITPYRSQVETAINALAGAYLHRPASISMYRAYTGMARYLGTLLLDNYAFEALGCMYINTVEQHGDIVFFTFCVILPEYANNFEVLASI